MMQLPCYLDYNATTPVDETVLAAMLPYWTHYFGNPSARHEHGRMAKEALETARAQVAALVKVQPSQVIFTSGGSEANNLAIKGVLAHRPPGRLLVSALEHSCIRASAQALIALGWQCDTVTPDVDGVITPTRFHATLSQAPTQWASVLLAHNETGVCQDISALAALVRAQGGWFHTDAVQAAGKISLDFAALGVHSLSLSGHKLGAPKGVGALIVDKKLTVRPLIHGGGQEQGRRAGTENVAALVGFGEACALAQARLQDMAKVSVLRARLEEGLQTLGAVIFGQYAPRVANTSYFAFAHLQGETLQLALNQAGFAVGTGAACSSQSATPSPSLLAMGVDADLARAAIRVSLGTQHCVEDIDAFLSAVREVVTRLRGLAALSAT